MRYHVADSLKTVKYRTENIAFLSNIRCSWALGIGHWALGIGHWALGIGRVPYFPENRYTMNYNSIRSRGVAMSRVLDELATPRLSARLYPKLCGDHTLLKMKAYYLDFRPKIINVYPKERI